MNDFHTRQSSLQRALLDPAQHVHYVQGMVLGADEFNQEFAYLSGHDQWISRDALGYGTLCGLQVELEAYFGVWEIVVRPGVAVTPSGRWVRVPTDQCAKLAEWLENNSGSLEVKSEGEGNRVATVHVAVKLYYDECLTDPVPVPGDACRTEQDSMQPSRIRDHFRIELSFESDADASPGPSPREEETVRVLVDWLRARVTIAEDAPAPDYDALLAEFRAAALSAGFPAPADKELKVDKPPAARTVALTPAHAEQFIRKALRVWVVELRDRWHPERFPPRKGPRPADPAPVEEGVLLAVLRLAVSQVPETRRWTLLEPDPSDEGPPRPPGTVNQDVRPWMLHLRVLQELVLHQLRSLPPPGKDVKSERLWNLTKSAGTSVAYSRADHTHGTPEPTGDVVLADFVVVLAENVAHAAKLPADRSREPVHRRDGALGGAAESARPSGLAGPGGTLAEVDGGDVLTPHTLKKQSLRVRALQTHPVSPDKPIDGDALVWKETTVDGKPKAEWTPTAPGSVTIAGDITGPLSNSKVVGLQKHPISDAQPELCDVLMWSFPDGNDDRKFWRPYPSARLAVEGDVTNTLGSTVVSCLRGHPVSETIPEDRQVLAWNGADSEWAPFDPLKFELGPEGGDVKGTLEWPEIYALQGKAVDASQPEPGSVLTFQDNAWRPRLPGVTEDVLRPNGTERYQIIAAGTIPIFAKGPPAVGTSKLRVTGFSNEHPRHALVEFTYADHGDFFERGSQRELGPGFGFIVKATLLTPPRPGRRDPLLDKGLAGLLERGQLLSTYLERLNKIGDLTIAVELVSSVGITMRVSTVAGNLPATLADASLMIEVSWCDELEREPDRPQPPRPIIP